MPNNKKSSTKSTSAPKRTSSSPDVGAKPAVRSADHPTPPMYALTARHGEAPSSQAAFAALGLAPMRVLTAAEMQPLLKADDQTLALISDNIVEQYHEDAALLGIKNLTPELLSGLYGRMVFLQPRVDIANQLATSASQQKLVAVSDLVDALLRIRRKVNALREDEPELAARWDKLLGYFDARYPGRINPGAVANANTVEPVAPEDAVDAPQPAAKAASKTG